MPSADGVRAVIDTNVLLSGLLWRGTPHTLIEQIRAGTLTLITSPVLLGELEEVVRRPRFHAVLVRSRTDPERLLDELRRLAEIVDPPRLPVQVSRDPDDDAVLALADASQADVIVSGDAGPSGRARLCWHPDHRPSRDASASDSLIGHANTGSEGSEWRHSPRWGELRAGWMNIRMRKAKARFPEIAEAAARGERVVVTKHGRPFVEVVPATTASGMDFEKAAIVRRELGLDGVTLTLPPTFDDPAFSRWVLGLED